MKMSGMFILDDVYEYMSKSKSYVSDSWQHCTDKYLTMIGFEFKEKSSKVKRYNELYTYNNNPNYVLGSDGTWGHIFKIENDTYIEVSGSNSFNNLVESWKELTGDTIDISSISKIDINEARLDNNEIGEDYRDRSEDFEDEMIGYIDAVEDLVEKERLLKNLKNKKSKVSTKIEFKFGKIYSRKVKQTILRNEMLKFLNFQSTGYSLNRMFFPTMGGEQCGNYVEERKFHIFMLDSIQSRGFEYIEEDEIEKNKLIVEYITKLKELIG